MKRPRIELAKQDILDFFDNQTKRVFALSEMEHILEKGKDIWGLPKRLSLVRFLKFLNEKGKLSMRNFPFSFQSVTLWGWGEVSPYELAMGLRPLGYLSHLSALRFHKLADADSLDIIYVNDEQKPKTRNGSSLTQSGIDSAFNRNARVSNNKVTVEGITYYLLNGMHTERLGVSIEQMRGVAVPIHVTNVERSLIDAVVRPAYAGGSYCILESYRRAAEYVDIEKMAAMLDKINYVYPYHQAIGFYLDAAGKYSTSSMNLFSKIPRNFDFYLDYRMSNPAYSKQWRIYYPSDLG